MNQLIILVAIRPTHHSLLRDGVLVTPIKEHSPFRSLNRYAMGSQAWFSRPHGLATKIDKTMGIPLATAG